MNTALFREYVQTRAYFIGLANSSSDANANWYQAETEIRKRYIPSLPPASNPAVLLYDREFYSAEIGLAFDRILQRMEKDGLEISVIHAKPGSVMEAIKKSDPTKQQLIVLGFDCARYDFYMYALLMNFMKERGIAWRNLGCWEIAKDFDPFGVCLVHYQEIEGVKTIVSKPA